MAGCEIDFRPLANNDKDGVQVIRDDLKNYGLSTVFEATAMPANIRHLGFSPWRSMLLVWENANGELPDIIARGAAPVVPAEH
ncbi:MAG: hypothetical protein CMM31_02205 [Rhodospirillaceae bacterium]|nr:hypothetical protein [Rhodospirillaceae bacterium]